jgi:polysaccharide biosynthesis/export protein
MPFKTALLGLALLLGACGSLPRGAGIEREVLARQAEVVKPDGSIGKATGKGDEVPAEFAVEPITRESLAKYATWPAVGEHNRSWIKRVDQPNTRIIAPGDMINLTIWAAEENSLLTTPGQRVLTMPPMQVSSSGQIFLPYVGQLKVSGMSPDHARSAVEGAYASVAPTAQVQLALAEGRQSTVSVLAGVAHAGAFPLPDQDMTVLDVLAAAGGAQSALKNPQLRLQRANKTYGIALERVLNDTALNTTLVGGDRIYVEEDDRYFLSLGAAGTRAQHAFPQQRVTALDALSLIGGLAADRANAQGILVLRNYPAQAVRRDGSGPRHKRTIFTLDLTTADGLFSAGEFQINPGDLIYVTESPLIGTRNVFGVIGSIFGLANQATSVGN